MGTLEPSRVEIREEAHGEDLIVRIEGELDLGTIPALYAHLRTPPDAKPPYSTLTLDLGAVTFMDSSGLRFLIELNERSQREGWALRLCSPRHEAATLVLRMTGADAALPFERASE